MSIKHVDAGPGPTVTSSILSYERTHLREHVDEIATEEPMEIRVLTGAGAEFEIEDATELRLGAEYVLFWGGRPLAIRVTLTSAKGFKTLEM